MAWGNYDEVQEDEDFSFYEQNSGEFEGQPGDLKEGPKEEAEPSLHSDPDEEEDSENDGHAPKTNSEKKRAQMAVMREYASRRAQKITKEEVREVLQNTDENKLSIHDILSKKENHTLISNPRDYQTELFQRAKDENIIAVLDTGTGKTHIATLLLRHILDIELEARAKGCVHKTAFFLVNSVNLVFQQTNVLRYGLDQKVEGICGAMGVKLWQKSRWERLLAENMVIVCTGDVLTQCLMHSFINIASVSVLIFDEAHHAKNNHAYARLMKEYYVEEPDVARRPRIFGMTASPVDANTDVREAAKALETLLHSRIATASKNALDRNQIYRPEEEVSVYPELPPAFETPFHQELKARYGSVSGFKKFFSNTKTISSELGRWAADKYWSFAFTEKATTEQQRRKELLYNQATDGKSIDELNKDIAQLQEAAHFVSQYDFGSPKPVAQDVSTKVLNLKNWLDRYYERSSNTRCIVFVEKRQTANLLSLIFQHIGSPNLHAHMLVGIRSAEAEEKASVRAQVMTVAKFRRGDLNCLFSTSVAEEGLDIPQCNLVIRFDLYRTMIAYVQSRGRARHRNSKYLHMVERGNVDHITRVRNASQAEHVMRNFCENLPQDCFLDQLDNDISSLFESEGEVYTDPKTKARLTYSSSLSVLAHFVASIPGQPQDVHLQPTYVIDRSFSKSPYDDVKQGWQCEVILPECAPIISVIGKPCSRKVLSRCSAAFEMCLQLRAKGFMDEYLLPTYRKTVPAMANAHLALSEKKGNQYLMRVKPTFWEIGHGSIPEYLYLTVINVDAGLERPHQPIGLLTRAPLPEMPQFPVFLKDGRPSKVISSPVEAALDVTNEQLELFTKATLLTYEDIYNKIYEDDISKISYWLLPIRQSETKHLTRLSDPMSVIDMKEVLNICDTSEARTQWTKETKDEYLSDKYLVDKWNGGRRFYSRGVVPHLKAQDPVPPETSKYKFMADILDFSISLWAKARQRMTWDPNQPVMEVEKILLRRNLLALVEANETEMKENSIAYVCPEPLKISTLPSRFVTMCYIFPAIIHRFESYLIARDACHLLGLNIKPHLALEALTKDSDNVGDGGEDKINFKRGMGPNYERLEFLGDCFLKMATSISTFVLRPNENEFEFHVRRMEMLCNRNLFTHAVERKLTEYIRTQAFSRRQWYPKGMTLLKGKKTADGPVFHQIGDKGVADVCEAFIGAAFLQHNKCGDWDPRDWDEAVKAVTIVVNSKDHKMEKFSDYYAAYEKPKYQLAEATATQIDLARQIESKHPYHFQYPRLLRSAFLHPSQAFIWEKVPHYQRLEFLGDALLDMAFIMHLFYKYPDKDPDWLTQHKTPMVCNKFLGAVSVKLGFHTHIRQNNAALSSEIRDYVTDIEEAEREANGAVDYWIGVTTEPPKCLADVVEAYVAAMFVDSEFDFDVVQTFFDMHLKRYFEDMTLPSYESFGAGHPVTRLGRMLNINFGCRDWRMSAMEMPSAIPGVATQNIAMVLIHGKVYFDGISKSGRYARPKAAKAALEALNGLAPYQFRAKYRCDCEDEEESGEARNMKYLEERMRETL